MNALMHREDSSFTQTGNRYNRDGSWCSDFIKKLRGPTMAFTFQDRFARWRNPFIKPFGKGFWLAALRNSPEM